MLAALTAIDPSVALYGLLAGTHGGAAIAAVRGSHLLVLASYTASTLLYTMFGATHYLQALAMLDANVALYVLLAGTHGGAAIALIRRSHRLIVWSYSGSALLYALFGASHYLHF